jgi:hypothetical protein
MKRITLRVPDHQHEALSRLLTLERSERGNRYSLNDLCTRLLMVQLSHNGASLPRTGAPAPLGDGIMHILRTPPPPPVPRVQPAPMENWTLRESPQPEHSARPNPEPELEVVPELIIEESGVDYVPDVHAEEHKDIEIERAEGEGLPDGHLDH